MLGPYEWFCFYPQDASVEEVAGRKADLGWGSSGEDPGFHREGEVSQRKPSLILERVFGRPHAKGLALWLVSAVALYDQYHFRSSLCFLVPAAVGPSRAVLGGRAEVLRGSAAGEGAAGGDKGAPGEARGNGTGS